MINVRTMALGAAMTLSLIGASSASAANWDPQGVNRIATQEGSGALTGGGASVVCAHSQTTLNATTNVARATAAANPVAYSGCTETAFNTQVFVTTFGTWNFIATSTTSVDAQVTSPTGIVATVSAPSLGCEITVTSPVNIPNNTWNNATHTLTINPAGAFNIDSTGLCSLVVGSTGTLDARYTLPSDVIIT